MAKRSDGDNKRSITARFAGLMLALLLLVLAVKPAGLFGKTAIKKV